MQMLPAALVGTVWTCLCQMLHMQQCACMQECKGVHQANVLGLSRCQMHATNAAGILDTQLCSPDAVLGSEACLGGMLASTLGLVEANPK